MPNKPWIDAIVEVLRDSVEPMHYSEIAAEIGKRKLRTSLGGTPKNTVSVYLNGSIRDEKDIFVKISPGYFDLKSKFDKQIAATNEKELTEEENVGVVTSIGMYWRYEQVDWGSRFKLLGRQQEEADPIDFHNQRGIYMLHDRGKVLYVGRVVDRPLGQRLFEHTKDRLSGRWERFSWFGLRKISDEGVVSEDASSYDVGDVIAALEAVLIEALESPQNRRRGDYFNAVEYMQVPRKVDNQKAMMDVMKRMLNSDT